MKSAKIIFIIAFVFGFCTGLFAGETPQYEPSEKPLEAIRVGERCEYRIRYLWLTVGEAVAEVKELTEFNGRPAYHVVLQVRSKSVVDLVYPVRDEHHSYIDAEKGHTLFYEKKISEGRYKVHEIMTYDQEKHEAEYYSHSNGSKKSMLIPKNVQDLVSAGFYFRQLELKENASFFIDVNADEKNWRLEVKTGRREEVTIEGVGIFPALRIEPVLQFEGLFVKRGKIEGWVGMEENRIPLKMKVKIPVLGGVVAEITEYRPGIISEA